ncbi:unnamed protein product [Rhizoctonia solani]|uniref:Iron-sulfur cluster assembly protein n=1 Tax=Rhizoctonia solani TaxID=456999 RepID=A0A8H3HNX0_9AGAM|nr:unnamed protein product [Rhizoctonia solani]
MLSAARLAIRQRSTVAGRRFYHEKVISHYEKPRNVGSMPKNDVDVGTGLVGAPACGDVMKLQIRVDENGIISDVKFKTFGCGSAIASSSYMTERVKGLSLDEAGKIKNTEIAQELSLPPVKLHCSMLAEDAIRSAIRDYRSKRSKMANPKAGGLFDMTCERGSLRILARPSTILSDNLFVRSLHSTTMDIDMPYGEGYNRNEPIMIGSSDDEEDNIQHRRIRRLGGPQGTPIPRRAPERGLRIFSPPPPVPPVRFGGFPFLDAIGIDQHELMRMLLDRPPMVPRVLAPIVRSRPPEPDPEPYDVRMTHASSKPRLGFTYDFEQPEEEKVVQPKPRLAPVKFKQTIVIPDSPPLGPHDKGKGKAKAVEDDVTMHKEIIEIYSDDEEGDSVASSSQPSPATKLTSVLICAGCRRPLRTGGDRLWALRCGHMIDSRCYNAISRPQFSSLPLLARLGSPPGPASKRRKTTKAKGKGKGVMESHEWECPVKDCARVHKSERMAGEEEWVPAKDNGAIKVFI